MDKNTDTVSEEISLKELLLKANSALIYLKSKWLIIVFCSLIGGILGFSYTLYKKPLFIATSTFVLDDSRTGNLSQYAGLASVAGIDLGAGNAGGIFQGDNIFQLYRSRAMIEKALLSEVIFNGKNQLLIDWYISVNKLRDKWIEKDHIPIVSFYGDPEKFNRQQDSIITNIVETFNQSVLNVTKLDKRLSIIKVDVITNDELFSKAFNNKLVETVNNFYTQTKTKKSYQNVQILQKQADSVKRVLNNSISGVASAIDAAPNANPSLITLRVPSQKKQVDVQNNTIIYSEIVKNLEVSKLSLRQETPLIQVIDKPVLPLPVFVYSKIKYTVICSLLSGLLISIIISLRKFIIMLIK